MIWGCTTCVKMTWGSTKCVKMTRGCTTCVKMTWGCTTCVKMTWGLQRASKSAIFIESWNVKLHVDRQTDRQSVRFLIFLLCFPTKAGVVSKQVRQLSASWRSEQTVRCNVCFLTQFTDCKAHRVLLDAVHRLYGALCASWRSAQTVRCTVLLDAVHRLYGALCASWRSAQTVRRTVLSDCQTASRCTVSVMLFSP
jgi:hypothetical protein